MPQGKKKVFRPKGSFHSGKIGGREMNDVARCLGNAAVQSPTSLECFPDNNYDPRFADMPPLEDINVCCNSVSDTNGPENTLFDKYNNLPKVIVSHFPYGVSEAQLLAIFEEFNPIMCRIMINAPTPVVVNASSACIYFKDERDALAAQKLDKTLYKNFIIEVKFVVANLF